VCRIRATVCVVTAVIEFLLSACDIELAGVLGELSGER